MGGPLVKRWTRLYRFLQLSEANNEHCLSRKRPCINGGDGGVLRETQIVRADQYVAAEAGLLNAQRGCPRGGVGLVGFGLGEACDVLNERDWSDVAALSAIAN